MRKLLTEQSQVNADDLIAARNLLYPAPVIGVHIGGGVHVPMPDSWDGVGPVPVGWSGVHGRLMQAAEIEATFATVDTGGLTGGMYAVYLPEDLFDLATANPGGILSGAQQTALLNAWAAADEIPVPEDP